MRHSGGRRHAARGAHMSSGGWCVAGVRHIQVGGASRWERSWGTGANR